MNGKKLGALAALIVLAVLLIVLCVRTFPLIPQVQEEMQTTPSPTPLIGNVMVVTPDPAQEVTRTAVLKNGSEGDAVVQLQTRLAELGYYTGSIDGQFGNATRTAVLLFQQQNGLSADGIFGAASSEVLYSEDALPCVTATPSPSPTPAPTATPELTATVKASRGKGYIRSDGLPLVVNKSEPLADDYETYDLVCMNDYCDSDVVKIKYDDTYAEREAVDALMVMLRAAHADGLQTWQISAAYRTVEYQQQLFDKQVATYMKENNLSRSKAITATQRTVADPGTSEHHLGTSFDITVPGKTFAGTKQSDWLAEHAWEYGFIQRYTKEKQSITGFLAEAWHYRWVGVEHSTIMHNEDLCLEEYIEKYGLIIDE